MIDINEIKKVIPHRYPFLFIDKIIEMEEGKKAVGIKHVSANEPILQGHFPDYPVLPGVIIAEALAQVGAFAVLKSEENKGKIGLLAGFDKMRFKRQVFPGDTLQLTAELISMKRNIGKAEVCAEVDGKVAAEGTILFAIADVNQ